jgi:hypothetical protein
MKKSDNTNLKHSEENNLRKKWKQTAGDGKRWKTSIPVFSIQLILQLFYPGIYPEQVPQ